MNDDFKFDFSLEILNHLGRGLYRNFATVIAEAISNSWDAEAKKVHITIDQQNRSMTIRDDGKGMDEKDFRDKFLKVGYTRRKDKENTSGRKVLGRKGIGKLAMLSISDTVTIITKKDNITQGGIIDNSKLDQKIETDSSYVLEPLPEDVSNQIPPDSTSGTYISFEGIKDTVNRPETIRKHLATMFNFTFSFENEQFEIFVNDSKVGPEDLEKLNEATQFLWTIGLDEQQIITYNNRFKTNEAPKKSKELQSFSFTDNNLNTDNNLKHTIKGFIASVEKPSNLKPIGIREHKAGLHLFVNGRIREENIFADISSARIVENYLYGEIHVDQLDDNNDIFTSSREGLLKDDPRYEKLLLELQDIQKIILDDWDKWRGAVNIEILKSNRQIDYQSIKPEIKEAFETFVKSNNEPKALELLENISPPISGKKILISHTSCDEKLASKVYQSLLEAGFNRNEIIYTSSQDKDTWIPNDKNIYDYLQEFFVQHFRYNPIVLFVVSNNMEKSWGATMEAGAAWVTRSDQYLFVDNDYQPKLPLSIEKPYITFDKNGDYSNSHRAKEFFKDIADVVKQQHL